MATTDKKKSDKVQAPADFNVPIGRAESAGWVAKTPGNIVQGRLMGRFEYRGKDKMMAYYQLELQGPCLVCAMDDEPDDNGDYPDPVEMSAGTVVNLGEVAALSDISKACEMMTRGAVIDIWTGFVRKDPNKNKQGQHWVLNPPRMRIVKQPTVAPGFAPASDLGKVPF